MTISTYTLPIHIYIYVYIYICRFANKTNITPVAKQKLPGWLPGNIPGGFLYPVFLIVSFFSTTFQRNKQNTELLLNNIVFDWFSFEFCWLPCKCTNYLDSRRRLHESGHPSKLYRLSYGFLITFTGIQPWSSQPGKLDQLEKASGMASEKPSGTQCFRM
jgi:hypothetical protein